MADTHRVQVPYREELFCGFLSHWRPIGDEVVIPIGFETYKDYAREMVERDITRLAEREGLAADYRQKRVYGTLMGESAVRSAKFAYLLIRLQERGVVLYREDGCTVTPLDLDVYDALPELAPLGEWTKEERHAHFVRQIELASSQSLAS